MEKQVSWLQLVLGAGLGVAGLLTPVMMLRWLGALTLLITMLLAWSRWQGRGGDSDRLEFRTPDLSQLERWFPWLFFTIAFLVVLILTLYTLNQLGLF
ncbi:MAG: hypothetical protein ACLFWD_02235 [Anaerolineales bacterium]